VNDFNVSENDDNFEEIKIYEFMNIKDNFSQNNSYQMKQQHTSLL
jgi:hypothetical protein